MIGLKRGTVAIAPYHPSWADAFEKEAKLLRNALGQNALAIEHMGSTAIPGMPSKPIIDLVIAVADLEQSKDLILALEDIGYDYRPHDSVPDRHFFAKGENGERTHHLSLVEPDSAFWLHHVGFRDHLRTNEQAAKEYANLKTSLASDHAENRDAYTDGKESFVLKILQELGFDLSIYKEADDESHLKFTSVENQRPGIIASMLKQSYAPLLEEEPKIWEPFVPEWENFDREIFAYPDTIGACVFLSWSMKRLVGFGSYDPRGRPASAIIGHNCILPMYRGKGFGNLQIQEVLRLFQELGVQRAKVSTNAQPAFVPAQHMYVSCGFKEIRRVPWDADPSKKLIEYEMNLSEGREQ